AKMDLIGSVLLALWVFCLLLGITNMDSFTLESILTPSVLVCFAAAIAAFILFIIVERRAQDPVFHLEYFSSRPIVVTMAVSFFIGCCIVSMMLIPQFAENALGLTTGSGGFYVLAIGILSLIGPPVGGKLIDKIGPKPVLMGGLAVMAAGFVYLAMIAAPNPTPFRLISGLAIVGLGMGFAIGAPTNYMILSNTREKDASSAIASIALVRQIGTTVSPAILVEFISAEAGLLGYQHMLLCVAAFSAIALVLMVLYRPSQTLAHD
ncbi:MAG: MFS transporter, partial [Coriobacteriales bacterium]|nr:MFS transporter [Coriobacteriales bacterium]